MKNFALIACIFVVVGCSQMGGQTNDDAPVAWIEVEPEPHTYQSQDSGFKQAEVMVDLAPGQEMELKLSMQEGDTVVYQWNLDKDGGDELLTEFHGHTERVDDQPGTLVFYKKHQLTEEQGSLTAPFAGDHGWYFNNQGQQDIRVEFKATGWFDKVSEIDIR